MAQNPRKNRQNGSDAATAAALVAPVDLTALDKLATDIEAEQSAATTATATRLTQLQSARDSAQASVERLDTLIESLGGGSAQPARGRRGRPSGRRSSGRRAGAGGGTRDPLGMKGYIAQALLRKPGQPMNATDLIADIRASGWKNDSATFNTQVYQISNKMIADGHIRKVGRGEYQSNAKTPKFLADLKARIKEKQAA